MNRKQRTPTAQLVAGSASDSTIENPREVEDSLQIAAGSFNIVLIGYRAAGKTSVGRNLADHLQCPFHDTDEMVVGNTGKTIVDLVAEGGWQLFREKEKSAVAGLGKRDGCVIALGGGAVLDEDNVERLRDRGLFIWLKADAGAIVNRIRGDGRSCDQRPSLSGENADEEVPAMLRSREDVYRRVARFSVDTTDRSIEEVSEEILRWLRKERPLRQDVGQK